MDYAKLKSLMESRRSTSKSNPRQFWTAPHSTVRDGYIPAQKNPPKGPFIGLLAYGWVPLGRFGSDFCG